MADKFIEDLELSMQKCIEAFNKELQTIRTGRANASMLDLVKVEYYGFLTPLNELAQVQIPEPRCLVIKPFDPESLKAIAKAITDSNLGLVPNDDGSVIRLNIPALSEDRRKEFVKLLGKVSENAKVSIRNIRRNANENIKKDKAMGEDVQRRLEQDVQKSTDKFIKIIDDATKAKEKEIMTI